MGFLGTLKATAVSPDQKQRMAFLTLYVLHEVRNAAEERTEDEED
jgi:hypothetical protein